MNIPEEKYEQFLTACHDVADYGLIRYSSGNLSWRIGENLMMVSASRTWLGQLARDEVAICRIDSRESLNGLKPSVEVNFHAGILAARPDVNVVLHFQSPCATAFACSEDARDTDFFVIPEVPYYIGAPKWVDFIAPGSQDLADAVTDAMRNSNLVLLRSHGLVTVGVDFRDAIQKAGFFELACEILLHGRNLRRLSPENLKVLLAGKSA